MELQVYPQYDDFKCGYHALANVYLLFKEIENIGLKLSNNKLNDKHEFWKLFFEFYTHLLCHAREYQRDQNDFDDTWDENIVSEGIMETAYAKYLQVTHPRFQETIFGETDVLSVEKVKEISIQAQNFRAKEEGIQAFLFSGGAQHWVVVFIMKKIGSLETYFADPVGSQIHQHNNISPFLECFTGDRIFEQLYCDCIFDSIVREWQMKVLELSNGGKEQLEEAILHAKSTFGSVNSKIREIGIQFVSEKSRMLFQELIRFIDSEKIKCEENSIIQTFFKASREIIIVMEPIFQLSDNSIVKTSSWSFMNAETIGDALVMKKMESNSKDLSLRNFQLTLVPKTISLFSNIENLNLQQNRFTEISAEILLSLPFLRSLNLNYNRLVVFPESICKSTNLVRLNIVGNKIEEIPSSISKLHKLNYFSISSNKIKTLPFEISKLTSLQVLCVSRNLLENIDILASLTSLRGLQASNNKISKIPESFSNLQSLEIFLIDQNNKFLGSKELYEKYILK